MRGGRHIDIERTKIRREAGIFVDRRSYIRLDGVEFLFGKDMGNRRQDVHYRDAHRCVACAKLLTLREMHLHHKNGRDHGDNFENLEVRCSEHHIGPAGVHP